MIFFYLLIEKVDENTFISEQVTFTDELNELIRKENYSPHQIFNLEEAGLFWKSLPDETYGASKQTNYYATLKDKE